MTERHTMKRTEAALRALDPATTTTLTEEERRHADATLARILATPDDGHRRPATDRRRRRRSRTLIPVGLLTAGAVAVPMALTGGSAFASWTPTPTPLTRTEAAAAATTCRADFADEGPSARVIGERRGGWTHVLVTGPAGESACLMPDDAVGSSQGTARRNGGFFGSHDPDPPEPPTPARDGLIENDSVMGAVNPPGRLALGPLTFDDLGLGGRDEWFVWVSGYAGTDVTGVTVHPPVGPDVEASLRGGRFTAWWPAGEARGDNPGVTGGWGYSVTLTDGTTRRVAGRP